MPFFVFVYIRSRYNVLLIFFPLLRTPKRATHPLGSSSRPTPPLGPTACVFLFPPTLIKTLLNVWFVLFFCRYRQFLSLHTAVSEHVNPQDMPHLPGKRILGSSVDPSFAEARGLALQVCLFDCCGSPQR